MCPVRDFKALSGPDLVEALLNAKTSQHAYGKSPDLEPAKQEVLRRLALVPVTEEVKPYDHEEADAKDERYPFAGSHKP